MLLNKEGAEPEIVESRAIILLLSLVLGTLAKELYLLILFPPIYLSKHEGSGHQVWKRWQGAKAVMLAL